jgi:hypothetical protein
VRRLPKRVLRRLGCDRDPEVGRQAREAGVPTLTDGSELPVVAPAVQLAEDDRRLRPDVVDVEADGRAPLRVEQNESQLGQLAEADALTGVEARGDDDPLDVRRQRLEVDGHPVLARLFVRTLAEEAHGAIATRRRVVEHEVRI